MIEDPEKAARLIDEMKAHLPIAARLSGPLIGMLSERSPELSIPTRCNVVSVFYAGEEGGIVCGFDIDGPDGQVAYKVSITHLRFDRRVPLFRQIDAYQRHRIKMLGRQARRESR